VLVKRGALVLGRGRYGNRWPERRNCWAASGSVAYRASVGRYGALLAVEDTIRLASTYW
jgi:hypothetical protein